MNLQRVAPPAALTAAALLAIGALTLRSAPSQILDAQKTPLDCLVCGDVGGADVLLNLALFIPLGIGLAGLRRSFRFAVATAFLVSLSVELLQYTVVVGRDATLSDLLTNTAGGAAGWLLAARSALLLAPGRRLAVRLTLAAGAIWLAGYLTSAWALHPAPPGGGYWGQWAHDFGGRGTFAGKVRRVSLNGHSLPDGPLAATPDIRARIASGDFDLAVEATSGRKWEDNAQIFGLANDAGDIVLEWRQKGRDYEFTLRSRASVLRLHSPELLLPGAAPERAGEPVTLRAAWRGGVITASAETAGRTTTRRLVLAPSGNWSFVWPWRRDRGDATAPIGAVWLGVTLVAIGFWAGRAAEPRSALLAGAAIALALGAGPALFGLEATSAADWIAAALGLALGFSLGRYMPSARSASGP